MGDLADSLTGPPGPAILITGVPRIGKTILARQVAALTAFGAIHTDKLRTQYQHLEDPVARAAERRRIIATALATRSGGLIIEGTDLILKNSGRSPFPDRRIVQDRSLSLELLSELAEEYGGTVFIVGCTTASLSDKAAAIRQSEPRYAFTAKLTDEQLRARLAMFQKRSLELQELAQERGYDYIEIGTASFHEDVQAGVARILARVDYQTG